MYQRFIAVGRLGRDPEISVTAGGSRMASFSLATSEVAKGEERAEWHRVVVWDERLVDVIERRARKETVSVIKEGNCFVGGSFQALDQIADTLCENHTIGRLTEVCERWVYSSCLCFGLDSEEQGRSRFRYQYSGYQLEYSRNLLFKRGATLDEVYQSMIERTRRLLDVDKLKTIFGWNRLRCHRAQGALRPPELENLR